MTERMIRVVHVDPLASDELAFQQGIASSLSVDLRAPSSDDDQELLALLADADAVVVRRRAFDRRLIDAAPKLKMIQKMGCRRDGIDIAAAREKHIGVALMSLPGTVAVAEHVFALILALARQIPLAHRLTVEGAYRNLGIEPKVTTERSHGFQWMKMNSMMVELRGLTLGIIGFGEIGAEISARARAFEMRVIYYNRTRLAPDIEAELGVQYETKEELLRKSDFVSLNTPLTPDTEKMIGAAELALMKPTAFIINASRGGAIDEPALAQALREKRIAGAGLDVFVQEPVPFDHPYLKLDNVILTPHIAGGKGGAKDRQPRAVYTNIVSFFAGQPVQYRIV